MEAASMGRVLEEITVENLEDLYAVHLGLKTPDQVRKVAIPDALVDTGASMLSLPTSVIRQLGLKKVRDRPVRAASGPTTMGLYEVVRLTVQGRECKVEVLEVPDGTPALLGQIPLELLVFVVDPVRQKLVGNPAFNGEQMYELYTFLKPPAE